MIVLADDADRAATLVAESTARPLPDLDIQHPEFAARRAESTFAETEQRRLAGPARPENRD
jgi:hypothetical protein